MQLIKRILNKLNFIVFYNKTVNNVTFKVPIINTLGFANFTNHEPYMDEVLSKLGSNNSSFLDVGVNVGQTLLKWKSLYPSSKYIGVEPNVACVYYSNLLIRENKLNNAMILPVGLTNKTGIHNFYVQKNDTSDIAATTINNFRDNTNVIELSIPTFKYDDVFDSSYNFDLIKIDVEGAELFVLASIFPIQSETKPTFICEILPAYNSENRVRIERQDKIMELMTENDYSVYSIKRTLPIVIEHITEFEIHGDLNKCEYLFIHNSNIDKTIEHFK